MRGRRRRLQRLRKKWSRRLQRLRKKWSLVFEGLGAQITESGELEGYVQYILARRTNPIFRVWGCPRGSWDNAGRLRKDLES